MRLCDKNECTGCSACVSVCPKKAISLKYDERGFLSPIIDENKCVNCKICTKICEELKAHMSKSEHKNHFLYAYATKIKNDKKRMESQSGGLFTALAETILEMNGIVYGAGFDSNNHVKHLRINEQEKLNLLKGSKYVQSDINNTFENVIKDLINNKIVLFSGTPCQVAGIEALLDYKKIDKENFYSCDFICHGVPSPKVYESFIGLLEKKKGSKIKKFNFRDKMINGWKHHVETYCFYENVADKIVSNVYCDLFYSNLALRKSCERCKYTSMNRAGDITMGDCWGIEKINPDLWDDNKGISICLIQTEHGKKLFDIAKNKMDIFEINALKYTQTNMIKSSSTPLQKEKFWEDYRKLKFEKLMKKYTVYGGLKFKVKRRIMKKINRW